ncbi:MAG: hypothetical protein LBP59_13685 [Planctomycetaceae bacterium]|jgi:hypothetical protein|nr:hypothetical protein [Planctomycetaceae bacterium]
MRLYIFQFCFIFVLNIFIFSSAIFAGELTLESGFRLPPDSAKVWAYWWWLNGNVDKDSITNDLCEIRRQGFSGALLCDCDGSNADGNIQVHAGPMFGTKEWRELYKHALIEASRLGMSISLVIQSGCANLGGPDVQPENAIKKIVWSEIIVTNNDAEIILPQPPSKHKFYRDIAVVALPAKQINVTKNQPQKNIKRRPLDKLIDKTAVSELNWSTPNCDYLIADELEVAGEEDAAVEEVIILSESDVTDKTLDSRSMLFGAASIGESFDKSVDSKSGVLKLPPLKKSGAWSIIRFGYTCTDARTTGSGQ